jgi:poly(A) polymerase
MNAPLDITAKLRDADWLRAPDTQAIMAMLDGADGRTRAVGGIVRDTLLERPRETADVDLATELTPDEVIYRAERSGAAVYPTGIEHGTVTLKLGRALAEVTTLREDVETDGRRAVVKFGTDWRLDAARRDFTINALYASMDGELYDPLGGIEDAILGRVRFIGDADKRIAEDRLRVFRFFRFSASHGGEKFDPVGLAACQDWAGRLDTVSAERVGAELKRMLALPKVATTLRTMSESGILVLDGETLARLQTYDRKARRPDVAARLALIMAERGADQLKTEWRLSNDDISTAEAILVVADLVQNFKLNEAAYRHPAALADGAEVAAVLAGWTDAGRTAVNDELQSLEVPRFPLSGNDLKSAGYKPGKDMGVELDRLEQLWIQSGFAMDRDELLAAATRPR